jgi:cytochrome P450
MISQILYSSELKAAVEKEIAPLFASGLSSTDTIPNRFEKCPTLTAIYHETLRTTTSSISAREVVSECTIGDLQFQPGTRVIIPSRQTLIDSNIFGSDAKIFDVNHFLRNPSLVTSQSFRPFGGGISYCPGRFLAQKEALSFTALLLNKFNVSVLDGQSYPVMDTAKPCLGIIDPGQGQDLLLRVKRRNFQI